MKGGLREPQPSRPCPNLAARRVLARLRRRRLAAQLGAIDLSEKVCCWSWLQTTLPSSTAQAALAVEGSKSSRGGEHAPYRGPQGALQLDLE
eukprot:g27382.t1